MHFLVEVDERLPDTQIDFCTNLVEFEDVLARSIAQGDPPTVFVTDQFARMPSGDVERLNLEDFLILIGRYGFTSQECTAEDSLVWEHEIFFFPAVYSNHVLYHDKA